MEENGRNVFILDPLLNTDKLLLLLLLSLCQFEFLLLYGWKKGGFLVGRK